MIAKGAGVEYSTLARWLGSDSDVRLSTLESLCAYLGLELREAGEPQKPAKAKPAKKKR